MPEEKSSGWQPIESAPRDRTMIVVRGINVPVQCGTLLYTTDPYCVWWDEHKQQWSRWPHDYEPTHWIPLPDVTHRTA